MTSKILTADATLLQGQLDTLVSSNDPVRGFDVYETLFGLENLMSAIVQAYEDGYSEVTIQLIEHPDSAINRVLPDVG